MSIFSRIFNKGRDAEEEPSVEAPAAPAEPQATQQQRSQPGSQPNVKTPARTNAGGATAAAPTDGAKSRASSKSRVATEAPARAPDPPPRAPDPPHRSPDPVEITVSRAEPRGKAPAQTMIGTPPSPNS